MEPVQCSQTTYEREFIYLALPTTIDSPITKRTVITYIANNNTHRSGIENAIDILILQLSTDDRDLFINTFNTSFGVLR